MGKELGISDVALLLALTYIGPQMVIKAMMAILALFVIYLIKGGGHKRLPQKGTTLS